jgi:hypothetical protein
MHNTMSPTKYAPIKAWTNRRVTDTQPTDIDSTVWTKAVELAKSTSSDKVTLEHVRGAIRFLNRQASESDKPPRQTFDPHKNTGTRGETYHDVWFDVYADKERFFDKAGNFLKHEFEKAFLVDKRAEYESKFPRDTPAQIDARIEEFRKTMTYGKDGRPNRDYQDIDTTDDTPFMNHAILFLVPLAALAVVAFGSYKLYKWLKGDDKKKREYTELRNAMTKNPEVRAAIFDRILRNPNGMCLLLSVATKDQIHAMVRESGIMSDSEFLRHVAACAQSKGSRHGTRSPKRRATSPKPVSARKSPVRSARKSPVRSARKSPVRSARKSPKPASARKSPVRKQTSARKSPNVQRAFAQRTSPGLSARASAKKSPTLRGKHSPNARAK